MVIGKLHLESALLPEGWRDNVRLTVSAHGDFEAVSFGDPVAGDTRVAGAVIPGVPNVHSHAHQRAMAGLAERAGPGADSFWTWREVMYGFLSSMTPDQLQAIAALLYMEMLKSGFTAVGEFQYLHHQPDGVTYDEPAEMTLRCLAAAEETGIGFTALPVLYVHGGFGGVETGPGQRRFQSSFEDFQAIIDGARTACSGDPQRSWGVAPHSLRAVSPEVLQELATSLDAGAPLHIHVAEQIPEVEDCLEWCGKRPVELLADTVALDDRWCLIHATHMTKDETAAVARSGAIAGLCPTTEANLGDGIFDAPDYLADGGAIAIGSDSHITVSPAEDLRMLEYSQRLRDRARNVLAQAPGASTGAGLLRKVLDGGRAALRRPLGTIAPGMRADLVALDTSHPALIGRSGDEIVDSWVFAGGDACVRDVFVGGRQTITNGRHEREDEIIAAYARAIGELRE